MRRLLTCVICIPFALAGVLLVSSGPAYAATVCQVTDPLTGLCTIYVEVSEKPKGAGPKDTGSGSACYWDGRRQGISKPPPGPVACSSDYGYWSNGYNCYIKNLSPQPPAGDPNWQGHEPGDGAVYQCYQPQTDLQVYVWSQDVPPGSGSGPTPRDVAKIAISQMDLRAIDIGLAPKPGGNSLGIVGMPVWMWVQGPGSHTYGPATATASAGGVTISATARVQKITWDMGDGTKVVCANAGTPYKASYGKKASPDCGHTYETSSANRPGGAFTVTATSDWVVTWRGAGQSGTIRLNGLRRSVPVAVGEAQALVK